MGTWSLLLDARPEDEESPEENRFAVLFRKPECTSKDSKPIKYEQARAQPSRPGPADWAKPSLAANRDSSLSTATKSCRNNRWKGRRGSRIQSRTNDFGSTTPSYYYGPHCRPASASPPGQLGLQAGARVSP